MKHTQGPWVDAATGIATRKNLDLVIPFSFRPSNEFDIKLIAAAPELLSALEMVMSKYSKILDNFAFEQCYAAISKAIGEKQK